MEDPTCYICGFKLSEHVATLAGPSTCPREASGEGRYVLVRPAYIRGGFFPGEEEEMPPVYRFEPAVKFESPYGHGWSPYQ